MPMVIALAKGDSQAANVMNANQKSLVTNAMHAHKITSIIRHVKVCLNNCCCFFESQSQLFLLFQSVNAILRVQPLCNVMQLALALAKMDLMVKDVMMNAHQITSTIRHVKVCINNRFFKMLTLNFILHLFQSVIVILRVQPLCNVMQLAFALANQKSLVTNVMHAHQITSTIRHVRVCLNNCFFKTRLEILPV